MLAIMMINNRIKICNNSNLMNMRKYLKIISRFIQLQEKISPPIIIYNKISELVDLIYFTLLLIKKYKIFTINKLKINSANINILIIMQTICKSKMKILIMKM